MRKKENKDQLVSILSYFLVGIIWFFADSEVQSRITRFHSKQALNLFVVSIGLSVLSGLLTILTLGLFALVAWAFKLFILVLWVLGLINAINQTEKEVPIVGQFAEKYLTY
ncbi:MAG: DUF4870 domain-containing protein [Candidatus Woesearchaeota archaeon]|nr:DUF4870 domain-containing protein [Nanoarchaeota archaeon]USN44499.1 MAG: DUF4870 domain-containing protein [Candidatus Woesearchaeota archaeon]